MALYNQNIDNKYGDFFKDWKIYYPFQADERSLFPQQHYNDSFIKDMVKQFQIDKPLSCGFDTETTGLNIAKGGDKAFLISFGWFVTIDRKLIKRSFVFETSELALTACGYMMKNAKRVWAWNTKFDINALRNTDSRFETFDYSNFGDGMALLRTAFNVEEDTKDISLKTIAGKYLKYNSKQFKNKIEDTMTSLKQEHRKRFKEYYKQATEKTIGMPEITKLENYDIFADDGDLIIYRNWLKINPKPNYYDAYLANKLDMLEYGSFDVIFLLELVLLFVPIVRAKDQLHIVEFENKIIMPMANQERNGIYVDRKYLEESKNKMKDYYNYIENEIKNTIELLVKNTPFTLKQVQDDLPKLFLSKPRKIKGVKVIPDMNYAMPKYDKYLEDIKNPRELNIRSVDTLRLFMKHTIGLAKDSWKKKELQDLRELLEKQSAKNDYAEHLINMKKFIDYLFILRRVSKWANTYIGRWLNEIDTSTDNRIHPSFQAYKTITGRFDSPFHQQPKDRIYDIRKPLNEVDENGEPVYEEIFSPRRMSIKDPNPEVLGVLVADLAQIEVRVNAEYTVIAGMPDDTLIDSILNDVDMHTRVAAEAFHHEEYKLNVEESEKLVTKQERNLAKGLNFLMQYGGSKNAIRTHPQLGKLSEGVQDDLFKAYQSSRKGTVNYQQWAMNKMKTNIVNINGDNLHYVENMYGKRYYASPLWVLGDGQSNFSNAYKAINYLIQGTCAYALKNSLILINDLLVKNNCKSKLILNVHDEVQVEIWAGEQWLIPEIKKAMETMPWAKTVPIISDLEWFNTTWDQKESIKV